MPLEVKVAPIDIPAELVPQSTHVTQPIVSRDSSAFLQSVPYSLAFHGALPIEPDQRARQLIYFSKLSLNFIESLN